MMKKKILTNMLGICNIELKKFKDARSYLEESDRLGIRIVKEIYIF